MANLRMLLRVDFLACEQQERQGKDRDKKEKKK